MLALSPGPACEPPDRRLSRCRESTNGSVPDATGIGRVEDADLERFADCRSKDRVFREQGGDVVVVERHDDRNHGHDLGRPLFAPLYEIANIANSISAKTREG